MIDKAVQNYLPLLPVHLREWLNCKKYDFGNGLVYAYNMQEGVDYLKESVTDSFGSKRMQIIPVDVSNTGVIQNKTQIENAVQQFLQIKHRLEIDSVNFSTVFMSYLSFIKRYEGNIFGMTGTLGSVHTQKLFKDLYKIDCFHIPQFSKNFFQQQGIVLAENEISWKNYIVKSAIQESLHNGRVTLIMLHSIKDVDEFKEILLAEHQYSRQNIITYSRVETTEADLQNLPPGKIILATNLAGRGTDIKTSEELELNGGMHIIMCYFAYNIRIEQQAFGRTARAGNNGSGKLVLNKESLNIKGNFTGQELFEYLYQFRDKTELETLQSKFWEVFLVFIRDELFQYFNNKIFPSIYEKSEGSRTMEFLRSAGRLEFIDGSKKLKDSYSKKVKEVFQSQMREIWGKWLDCKDFDKILDQIMNITEKIYKKSQILLKKRLHPF